MSMKKFTTSDSEKVYHLTLNLFTTRVLRVGNAELRHSPNHQKFSLHVLHGRDYRNSCSVHVSEM